MRADTHADLVLTPSSSCGSFAPCVHQWPVACAGSYDFRRRPLHADRVIHQRSIRADLVKKSKLKQQRATKRTQTGAPKSRNKTSAKDTGKGRDENIADDGAGENVEEEMEEGLKEDIEKAVETGFEGDLEAPFEQGAKERFEQGVEEGFEEGVEEGRQ